MNERIKQIAADCGLYIAYDNREVTAKELKHFVQLIVQECLKDIETAAYYDSCEDWEYGYNSGLNKAKELIVNRFEVEE